MVHGDYKFTKSREKVNYFIYMNDIKIFPKNERDMENLIKTIRIYNQVIRMEFGIEKRCILTMKKWWRERTERIKLQYQEIITKVREKEN